MRRPRRRLSVAGAAVATVALVMVAPLAAHADQVRGMEFWLADYGVSDAWSVTRGAGVTVAIIDTGVDGSVPDLAGAVVGGTDVSGIGAPNGQKPIGPDSGHGTWVASLLAGRGTGDGSGVIGVAPEASLLSISVALGDVDAPVGTDRQIADAVRWAVDHGADVINMSLTRNTLSWPTSWDRAFEYAFAHDVVIVAAAGNRGSGTTEVGAPATIPGVLTVAGVDRDGTASFDASSQGITIGVSAPSEQLVGADPGGGYVQWEGTSGAAPLVSGEVALVRSAFPDLDAANVINRVVRTATPAGGEVPSPIYGYGLMNAAAAVTAEVPHVTENPMGSLQEWIRLHRRSESTPQPTASAAPNPGPTPAKLPPERRVTATDVLADRGIFLAVSIPLALLVGLATLVALAVVGARRHFRRSTGRG